MVDLDDEDFYVVDLFRVVGGKDHAKFYLHFGEMNAYGLTLHAVPEYGHGAIMRNFADDANAKNRRGWYVDWQIDDRYGYLPAKADVRIHGSDDGGGTRPKRGPLPGSTNRRKRCGFRGSAVRRQSQEKPLASAFVGLLEPYRAVPKIAQVVRLPLQTLAGTRYPGCQRARNQHRGRHA